MKIKNLGQLLDKVRSGKYSAEEEALLEVYIHQYNMEGPSGLTDEDFLNARINMLNAINQARFPVGRRIKIWPGVAIAASIALIIFSAALFYYTNHKSRSHHVATYTNDVSPGIKGATLTLSNGKKIRLTDAVVGEIAEQAGIGITKTSEGQLVYEMKFPLQNGNRGVYNTLTTARGESYMLILPDSSRVWLNAASSLTYPANLGELKMRQVRLEGEAYFEISRNQMRPFKVESRGQVVEVLGTHFNVNSYGDEHSVITTLMEGQVKVTALKTNRTVLLQPGQQSRLLNNVELDMLPNIDVEDALAWKNGYFQFNGEDLYAVMRQLKRWYNVEIDVQKVPKKEFYGAISRDVKLSQVLKMLELAGKINFEIKVEHTDGYERRKIMIK